MNVSVCVTKSVKTFSLPQTTLVGHFQNATVDFLQPIEDPITISFAALPFAHNDRQNVSLVCPRLSSPPLHSLSGLISVSLADPLCLEACHSLTPLHTHKNTHNCISEK